MATKGAAEAVPPVLEHEIITPYQYLRGIKKVLNNKLIKLKSNKNLLTKSKRYIAAATYKSIENKLSAFMEGV